jgi:hypothetical protein
MIILKGLFYLYLVFDKLVMVRCQKVNQCLVINIY